MRRPLFGCTAHSTTSSGAWKGNRPARLHLQVPGVSGGMRAAVYARVSTEAQAERGASLEEQIERCSELARRMGATGVDTESYLDRGWSGADAHRPGMRRLLRDCREGLLQIVVCYSLDRWARDLADQLYLAREVDSFARLEFYREPRGGTPEEVMFFQMRGAFSEFERALIRRRTLTGRRRKAEKGELVHPPLRQYGYRYDKENRRLLPFEPEARVVRRMAAWTEEEGLGAEAIARRLNRDGVPAPRGGVWRQGTVRRILRSEVYAGVHYQFRWSAPRGEGHVLRPREEWLRAEVPAILPREQWQRIQGRIDRNGQAARRRRYHYLLAGFIRCGVCGARYYTYTTRLGPYYRCATALGKAAGGRSCPAPSVPGWTNRATRGLDELVWEALVGGLADPRLLAEAFRRRREAGGLARRREELAGEAARAERQAEELDRHRDELLDLRLEGLLSPGDLRDRMTKLRVRRAALGRERQILEETLATLAAEEGGHPDPAALGRQVAACLGALTKVERRELLRALDVKVTVFPGRRVVVEWPLPAPGPG